MAPAPKLPPGNGGVRFPGQVAGSRNPRNTPPPKPGDTSGGVRFPEGVAGSRNPREGTGRPGSPENPVDVPKIKGPSKSEPDSKGRPPSDPNWGGFGTPGKPDVPKEPGFVGGRRAPAPGKIPAPRQTIGDIEDMEAVFPRSGEQGPSFVPRRTPRVGSPTPAPTPPAPKPTPKAPTKDSLSKVPRGLKFSGLVRL